VSGVLKGRTRGFLIRLAGLFRKGRQERELAEEFESHFRMHVEENLRRAMSASEAQREARLKFGGIDSAKERMREGSTIMTLETTWQDLRYAIRGMRGNPGFAVTAILSMALGIGASVAIFTLADNLLLRPLPYGEPGQLTMVWEVNPHHKGSNGTNRNVVSPANYLDWKAQNTVFESIAVFGDGRAAFADGARVEELEEQYMSADLLPMLGVRPWRGRLFTAAEDLPNAPDVVLISYRLWQSWFGGGDGVVGRKVQLRSRPATIIGVMPPGFYFRNRNTDLWETEGLDPARDYRKTAGRFLMSVARLKHGVTRDQAQTQMTAIARRLETDYPRFDTNWTVNVESLRESLVSEVKTSMLVLLGAVGLLLAVACANVANLLLARYTSRRREMAVRVAIGAGRGRVVRQLITESVTLGLAGGVLGVLLARWAVMGLLALAPVDLSRNISVAVDYRIVLFAVAVSVLTGVIFGLAPSFVAARADLTRGLREDSRGSVGGSGHLRAGLVAAEVALCVMLLAGAGLLFRSLIGLQSVDPGLNPSRVLTFSVLIPGERYREPVQRMQFFSRALEQIENLPGVELASAVSFLPFNGMSAGTDLAIAGRPPAKPGEELVATIRTVMPGYFRTMEIPLKRGRVFTAADNTLDSPYRFVVNQEFARKYMAGEEPVGQQISVAMDSKNPLGEIIGVVGNVKEGALDQEPAPTVYYIHAHLIYTGMVFVVRAKNDPLSLADPVRRVIHGIDPAQPVAQIRTMDSIVRETFARQRFSALLLGGFSLVSLLLAAVGIYGVLAYSVTERTREIGVRVALGAEPGRILGLVLGSGMRTVLAGAVAGMGGALALTGLLKSLLFGVKAHDAATFAAAPVVLIAVALLAAYLPARRAARLAPVDALRTD
jgi:putative ABC transport system permease protein